MAERPLIDALVETRLENYVWVPSTPAKMFHKPMHTQYTSAPRKNHLRRTPFRGQRLKNGVRPKR